MGSSFCGDYIVFAARRCLLFLWGKRELKHFCSVVFISNQLSFRDVFPVKSHSRINLFGPLRSLGNSCHSLDLPRVAPVLKRYHTPPSYQLDQLWPCGVAGAILLDHDGLHDLSGATQMTSSPSAFPFDPYCVQSCR